MVDKTKQSKSRYEEDENNTYSHDEEDYDDHDEFEVGNNNNYRRNSGGGSKYEKLYGVIDALVDQVDMPRNRIRAIKFGIRALGELLSETENRRSGGGQRKSQGNSSNGSGQRGVTRTNKG